MAEVLVVGKKISEMDLVTDIVGDEKIPTGVVGDKAVTTGQLLTYLDNNGKVQWGRIEGDISNQADLQNQFTQERDTLKSYTQDQVSQQQAALQEHIDATNEVFKYTRENGSALPYKEDITYEENSVVVKDGVLQQWKGGEWEPVVAASLSDTIQTFNTPEAGVDPVTGVADGAYFNVRSSNDESYGDEYQNVGGVPTPSGKSYPSVSALTEVKDAIISQDTGKATASKVFDDNNIDQQTWNDGLASISDLIATQNPKEGSRYFVKGLQGGWFEYNSDKSSINNGVTVFNGWVRISMETGIKPEWAGAPRNGGDDDAPAFRSCIAYLAANGGGRVILPSSENPYIFKSKQTGYDAAVVLSSNSIYFDFETTSVQIRCDLAMNSMFLLNSMIYKTGFSRGNLNGNNLANYCIYTNPAIYTPQVYLSELTAQNAIKDQIYLQTYVSKLEFVTANGGERGIVIRPTTNNIVTSCVLTGCYALNQSQVGYHIAVGCYVTLISCAADHMPLAYELNMRGGAMIGCGAENIEKIARFTSFRGISINGFYSQRAGSTDSENPTDYLLEFVTGTNATLSGFHLESNTGRYYGKKVGITTKNYAFESLTVTDQSILRSDIYFIANSGSNRPIKLLFDDTTQRDLTVNISSMAQFREYIATYLDDYEINHTLTIQLANGTYNFGDIPSVINSLRGTGRLIIRGNASNRASVKLETEIYRLIVRNCQCLVEFRDLTLSGTVASAAAERLRVDGSNVQLTNVLISRNGISTAYGIRALSGSVVRISTTTEADSNAFGVRPFGSDATSRFVIDPVSTAPTTLNWSQGMTVENSNPVTNIGWVFSNGAWKEYGAIT